MIRAALRLVRTPDSDPPPDTLPSPKLAPQFRTVDRNGRTLTEHADVLDAMDANKAIEAAQVIRIVDGKAMTVRRIQALSKAEIDDEIAEATVEGELAVDEVEGL